MFWVVDNGTSHRGDRCRQRLARQWPNLTALEDRLLASQQHYQAAAKPFRWRFSRHDLDSLLARLAARSKAA